MIYLDNAATTRMDERVFDAMRPYLLEQYANPSGAYSFSGAARRAVKKAREQVAALINADPEEIIFTSGGTEADNMALKGLAGAIQSGTILSSAIEHPAVLNPLKELQNGGIKVKLLSPDSDGIFTAHNIREHVTPDTKLLAFMAANNEIGSLADFTVLKQLKEETGAFLFTDAVQAVGHIPLDVRSMGIDALSGSGHKLHGPKGTGFLFLSSALKLKPLILGGGQEKGMRSGTENVAGIVGLGAACEIAAAEIDADAKRMAEYSEQLVNDVMARIPECRINGPQPAVGKRLPNNINLSFKGIEGASLLIQLDMRGICVSTGSACSASRSGPSHVLTAIEPGDDYINGSVRITLSRFTTKEEIDSTVQALAEGVSSLRSLTVY